MNTSTKFVELDTEAAASLIDVTPRRLRQLASDGWFKNIGRNKWSAVGVVHGYVKFLKSDDRNSQKSIATARVTNARTRQIELSIAKQEGSLIPLDEHNELIAFVAGLFLTQLSSLPARITRNVRERSRIEVIIDESRASLSKKLSELTPETKSQLMDFDEVQSCFAELVEIFITCLETLPKELSKNPQEQSRIEKTINKQRTKVVKKMKQLATRVNILKD